MGPEEIAADKAIISAATPGPWDNENYPSMPIAASQQWSSDCLAKGQVGFFLIQSRLPKVEEDSEHPTIATTGNGPTSAQNAAFIAAARTRWPLAIAEVDRLREVLSSIAFVGTDFPPAMEEAEFNERGLRRCISLAARALK